MFSRPSSEFRACVVLPLVLFLAPAAGGPAGAERIRYGPGRTVATLADKKINESSGLAASRRTDGVFWTHNDSGDGPVIYAFNRKGESLATCRVTGASARDWEDMASFTVDGKDCLLLADIGDNASRREFVTLYIVPEPPAGPQPKGAIADVPAAITIRVKYPDGPQDCESVAVDPTAKAIYLITKTKSNVYELPLPASQPKDVLTATKLCKVAVAWATAMDISPDGRRAVVLTYGDAHEFVRADGETWAQAFARAGRKIAMPKRRQGESICYGRDGRTLYLTSEKLPTPLIEVPVVAGK